MLIPDLNFSSRILFANLGIYCKSALCAFTEAPTGSELEKNIYDMDFLKIEHPKPALEVKSLQRKYVV